jgi:predicted HTH transcriptional regulator
VITSVAQIDLWRSAATESQNLEFKEAKSSFDRDKLARYCVALANEGGGMLLLGIGDKHPRPVVGTNAFANIVSAADELFIKIGFRVEIEEVNHPDGRVLIFHAPSRPRGTAYHLEGQYLMRSGESLRPMSEDRLRAIFAEGAPDWLEEPALANVDDQSVVDLLDTQTYFELLKLPYPSDRKGVLERLRIERLIDKTPSGWSIRRLAGVLLAKKLDAFPELGRKAARVVVYNGIGKVVTRLDQTGARGYAVGFQGLVDFVMTQLPQNEVIENALRKQVKLLPTESVRELIANALVHQDVAIHGAGPMIEIYDNRMEISNPGEPIVPVERFIDGYQSRNERLADIMRRMNICEEKSSGIDRVVQQAEIYQLPAPEFRATHKRTVVIVYGPRPFSEMDRNDRIRACYQHCALRYVTSERMTNQSLRERFGLTEGQSATASQIINAALDSGLIKADEAVGGSKKYARYLPAWA